jgi:DDE superfamily endonuclease
MLQTFLSVKKSESSPMANPVFPVVESVVAGCPQLSQSVHLTLDDFRRPGAWISPANELVDFPRRARWARALFCALASRGIARLDRAYAEHRQIRLVLDNHSAHISKETHGHLHSMPQRLVFVFSPTRGSWLNLIESQFSPGRVSLEVQDG